MLCPICKNVPLADREMATGLKSFNCNQCNGNWVRASDYENWKTGNAELENIPAIEAETYSPEFDTKKANLCPDCGRILIKSKVSSKLPFSADRCGSCNGIWLDCKEWECLVDNNLYKQLNEIFTSEWQEKIRKEITFQHFEEHYEKKFGEQEYIKLKEVREWIYNSKLKGEMLAYLMDKEPYKL